MFRTRISWAKGHDYPAGLCMNAKELVAKFRGGVWHPGEGWIPHAFFFSARSGGYERVRPDKNKLPMFFCLANITKVFMTKVTNLEASYR
jgi:hypothetical protein